MALLTAIDLFSGCGGLTEGLKQAGFSVVGAVEIDRLAVETYRANHPDVGHVWTADIRHLPVSHVKKRLRLLAGCPPCQGFSSMRTRNRGGEVDDPRNDLVFDFLRFVLGLQPKTVMMENVPGLKSNWRMQLLLSVLKCLGYHLDHLSTQVCDVADYGVPQRRRRLLLLTSRAGPISIAPAEADRRTVKWALQGLRSPGTSGDMLHDLPEKRSARVLNVIQQVGRDGGSRGDLEDRYQLECHKNCDGFKDVYGRMAWDSVAPTITSGCVNPSKGRFLHPDQDRAITLREAALLQSFPRDYQFSLRKGKFAAAKLIGNALPPEFVRRHAQIVAAHLADLAE